MNMLIHIAVFGTLGGLLSRRQARSAWLLIFTLAVATEYVQPWFGRMYDPVDIAINIASGLSFFHLTRYAEQRHRKRLLMSYLAGAGERI